MHTASHLIQLPTANGATIVRLTIGDHSEDATPETAIDRAGALMMLHGSFPSVAYFAPASGNAPAPAAIPATIAGPAAPIVVSNAPPPAHAAARVEVIRPVVAPAAALVPMTRAAIRERAYLAKRPAADALDDLAETVRAERRVDIEVSAAEFGRAIEANGKVRAWGYRLSEQAIRGFTARTESPALGYLLGVRSRLAAEHAKGDAADKERIHAEVARIAETIRHECKIAGDVPLKFRARKGPGDLFACVSPSFTAADADRVAAEIASQLPAGSRGSFSYDPTSTAWTFRLDVRSADAARAVGEPVGAYIQINARDNGTGSLRGGGGIVILACLNGMVRQSNEAEMRRVHRRHVLVDLPSLMRTANAAIDKLAASFYAARTEEIAIPVVAERRLTIQDAIPGFYRGLLTDRRSELQGVLPGRTESHVAELARVFRTERRDQARLVRADLAQGWTRYAQEFDATVQHEAETAIGEWLASARPIPFVAAE